MKRTNTRLAVCVALLVLTLCFIWGNSCLPGETSGALSAWLKDLIASIFGGETASQDKVGHGLLRKLAHFTEFACLGVWISWLVHMLRNRRVECFLIALASGAAAAGIDEGIQCFVPGRGPGIKDVGIDTLGVLLGVSIISLIAYKNQKKNKNNILEEQLQ